MQLRSTICALATPPGEGGIAVVRLSGPDAYPIADKVFAPIHKEKSVLEAKGYTDCVAYITAQECSVVLAGAVEEADTLIVQEVVMEQTGLTADKIKIIGTN